MAVLVQGFMKLQVAVASVQTDVPGVTNVAGGGRPGNPIDTTDFDTPAGQTESIEGPRGNSPFTADLQYMPENTIQESLFEAEATNTPLVFRIKAGTKGTTFSSVPVLTLAAPVAGKVTYSLSLVPLAAAVRATITP